MNELHNVAAEVRRQWGQESPVLRYAVPRFRTAGLLSSARCAWLCRAWLFDNRAGWLRLFGASSQRRQALTLIRFVLRRRMLQRGRR